MFGLDFLIKYWKLILSILGLFLVLIIFVVIYQSCKPVPKLNEKEIQEAITAIEQKNDQKLREILANSDIRVQQAETNQERTQENLRQAEEKAKEIANRDYSQMSTDELAAEIERRANQ